MKIKKIRIASLILFTLLLFLPINTYSESAKSKNLFDFQYSDVELTYIRGKIDMKSWTFTGDVTFYVNEMEMRCDELTVFLKESLKKGENKDSNSSLDYFEKIVATGSVVINVPEKGEAKADKAEFFIDSEKIVLSGNPRLQGIWDGRKANHQGGNEIIWYVNENSYEMNSTKDNKFHGFITSEE